MKHIVIHLIQFFNMFLISWKIEQYGIRHLDEPMMIKYIKSDQVNYHHNRKTILHKVNVIWLIFPIKVPL